MCSSAPSIATTLLSQYLSPEHTIQDVHLMEILHDIEKLLLNDENERYLICLYANDQLVIIC